MDKIVSTFLDLADIDEVFPNEKRVLAYITNRLRSADVPYRRDAFGNIVARVGGESTESLAICAHTDIAAPLTGRRIIVEDDIIKTDGKGLLGGDDKTAVAAMLELADYLKARPRKNQKTVELIFTVGEEIGAKGAIELDMSLVSAKGAVVLDWHGGVQHIVAQSPAYYRFDITYKGKDTHPANWRQGKNAGAALMAVASSLPQGEYASGVLFNIGEVHIGSARNKVPGLATLRAEARSFDAQKAAAAAKKIEDAFREGLKKHHLSGTVDAQYACPAYAIDREGNLLGQVVDTLKLMNLRPKFETTYGGFDGNVLAAKGLDIVIQGAAYYNPHDPDEYVKITELTQMLTFLKTLTQADAPLSAK